MNRHLLPPSAKGLFYVLTLLVFSAASVLAEDVFITAFKGTAVSASDDTPCPPSCVTLGSGTGSGAVSTASPVPVIPASGRRSRFGTANNCTWAVTPTDIDLTPIA